MDAASLLYELTPTQRRAVETDAAPLCILAGAGSGKTRVLTRRIAYRVATGQADAGHVLALTFTRRAAGELGERLRGLGVRGHVTAGTFHAVAYAQLRQYWADRGEPAPQLLDHKARLLARLVVGRPDVAETPLCDLAAEIEWAVARLIAPEQYPAAAAGAGRRLPARAEAIAALYARYQTEKQRLRLADFDDLLDRCARALERDGAFAAVQRWRWRHLFVDEFQDLNPLQYRLLSAWLGDGIDVCVVGDPNQAVYGWNGADPSLLAGVATRWPGTEVVRLDDNHRCTPQVVTAASRVLGSSGRDARSSRPDGLAAAVRTYPSDTAEAYGVVAELRQGRASGRGWSDMAILVRTNAQMATFEAACRSAQVPYRLAGARPMLDDPNIQTLLGELRDRRDETVAAVAADLAETGAGSTGGGSVGDRPGAARLLAGLANDFQRLELRPTVEGFLSWLGPATSRDRVDEGVSGVTISTFHRAKGLEWPVVWIAGIEEGLVPIAHARTDDAEAEERRLLYVAITRARDELHCSWAEQRTFGAHAMARRPSPWLAAIAGPDPGLDDGVVTPADRWRERLGGSRDQLATCRRPASPRRGTGAPEADPAVITALRAWRSSAARANGVPAHVLLHDATLKAIATRRPATVDELLGVPGLGPVKVARYGTVLLDLVADQQASA